MTKGTGLLEGLGDLGISRHSTVAIGDAENDHHLIDVCENGVAVANAVDALKRHADIVLEQPDGEGSLRSWTVRCCAASSGCIRGAGRSNWGSPTTVSQ